MTKAAWGRLSKKSDSEEFEWVLAHNHLTEFKPQKPSDGGPISDDLITFR